MKHATQTILLAAISYGVIYFLTNIEHPYPKACIKSPVSNNEHSSASNGEAITQDKKIHIPRQEVNHSVYTKQKENSISTNSSSTDKEYQLQDAITAAVATNERAKLFNDYLHELTEKQESNLVQDMEKKFTEESTDIEWSESHSEKLQQFFNTNTALSHIYPETIQCKSNRCKISIPVSNPDEANIISETFMAALNDQHSPLKNSAVVTTQDDARAIMNLYVARSAETNLFQ